MGQVLHGSATTTDRLRRAIQNSQVSLRALAGRYGMINQKTVAKWKKRETVAGLSAGPKDAKPTVLSIAFNRRRGNHCRLQAPWRHTLLLLDDCLYAPQVCAAGDDPVSDALVAAPMPAAPRRQPIAGNRRRQACKEKVRYRQKSRPPRASSTSMPPSAAPANSPSCNW